ncbi:hypothetical protein WN51_09665 [Melipona quadrifasciata]|uniref:Amino acid transporter transmembrane domain-containing protein n=1 Tax=Melipona quadrifasciata TaxID=166423 RepID=A0A0M9A775_9HYME|nr:hypothetical protein WN51_09665 [Melipona quadrifasciata]
MPEQNSSDQYSTWVGLIYVFNLIVGTGALTLPAVFSQAGWALGLSVILILAFISFITVTFVIEVMASANAIVAWRHIQHRKRICFSQDSSFNETESEVLQTLGESGPSNSDSEDTPLVMPFSTSPDRADITYRYYVIRDKIEMGQMASIFFNKFGMRWLAFTIMIVYALKNLIIHGAQGNPPAANIMGIPTLFGACIYSFMCHHSLPALVAPIANKSTLTRSLALDYLLIAFFYLLLALTGAFAFEHLDDLYTLDFSPRGSGDCSKTITLRNNLQSLFLNEDTSYFCLRKIVFPILAILPPYMIAMSTKDLSILVGITGSYAGAGIQYLIPTFLVYYARQRTNKLIGLGVVNKFASPFSSNCWLIFVIVWAIACMILVSVNFVQIHFYSISIPLG